MCSSGRTSGRAPTRTPSRWNSPGRPSGTLVRCANGTRRSRPPPRVSRPRSREPTLEPLDDPVDHVRGPAAGGLILEYGDYECPYSRHAFHQIEIVEKRLDGGIRFAFRHFPLTEIHPHAL